MRRNQNWEQDKKCSSKITYTETKTGKQETKPVPFHARIEILHVFSWLNALHGVNMFHYLHSPSKRNVGGRVWKTLSIALWFRHTKKVMSNNRKAIFSFALSFFLFKHFSNQCVWVSCKDISTLKQPFKYLFRNELRSRRLAFLCFIPHNRLIPSWEGISHAQSETNFFSVSSNRCQDLKWL